MPIYEYKCTVCDDRFDIEQRISDDALTSLAGCQVADDGDHRLKKVFSAIGIAFKGDGFYRNDARSKAKSKAAAPSKDSSESSSSPSKDGSTATPSSTDSSPASSSGSKSSNGTPSQVGAKSSS